MNIVNITGRIANLKPLEKCTLFSICTEKTQYNHDDVTFIDCIAFSNNAKFLNKYFEKGKYIEVSGHLDKSEYKGQFTTKVIADNISFCGKA